MDFYSFGGVLYDFGARTYVCNCDGDSYTNHCVQGSHCACQCARPRKKDTLFQSPKLVFETLILIDGRYFLATTMFFLYGESLIYYFKHIVFIDEYFLFFAIHHRFISAVLYLIGTLLRLL